MEHYGDFSGTNLPNASPQLPTKKKRSSFLWHPDQDNHHQHERPSVSGMAVNLARTLSHMSAQKSLEAMHKVGSFLGVTQEDNHMDQWKEKFIKRVESGDIGFNVENILPEASDQELVIKQIEKTISQVSAARHEQDLILDDLRDGHADEYVIASDIIYEEADTMTMSSRQSEMRSQHSTLAPDSLYSGLDGLPSVVYKTSKCDYLQAALSKHIQENSSHSLRQRKYNGGKQTTSDFKSDGSTQSSLDCKSSAAGAKENKETTFKRCATVPPELKSLDTVEDGDMKYTKHGLGTSLTRVHGETKGSADSHNFITSRKSVDSSELPKDAPGRGQLLQERAKPRSFSDYGKSAPSSDISDTTWGDTDLDVSESSIQRDGELDERSCTSSVHFNPVIASIPTKKTSSKDMVKSVFKRKIYQHQQAETQDTDVELQKDCPSKSILKEHEFLFAEQEDSTSDFGRGFDGMKSSLFSMSDKQREAMAASEPVFVYRAEALKHYQQFVVKERIQKKLELDRVKLKMEKRIKMEQELLRETMELSKEQYNEEQKKSFQDTVMPKWNRLLSHVKKLGLNRMPNKLPEGSKGRLIQSQLDQLPEYTAWFTYIMCLIQILTFLALIGMGGVTSIGLEPTLELRPRTLTFKGLETAEHWRVHNIWIGPSATFMISVGALFAPCMRSDIGIRTLYATQIAVHNDSLELGCCEVEARSTAGTTTQAECQSQTVGVGNWTEGTTCSTRGPVSFRIPQVIRPCCYGLKGQCKMTSHEHCVFLEGIFHDDDGGPENCIQVNCLSGLCGGLDPDPTYAYIPHQPNQWWRILVPLIYNQGVIQLFITIAVQLIIGRPVERTAGPVRVAIIYVVSGIMGLLIGSTMSPYSPQLGAGGAIFGLIGVLVVELAQSWHLIHKPWLEVLKLVTLFTFFLISGTLPFVDNFTLLGGFIFGLLTSVAVLPYITFGKWHIMRKRLLILIVTPFMFILIIVAFVMFYKIQTVAEVCGKLCEYFNCLPYTDLMCKTSQLW